MYCSVIFVVCFSLCIPLLFCQRVVRVLRSVIKMDVIVCCCSVTFKRVIKCSLVLVYC